jgi:lipase maturation factor 1
VYISVGQAAVHFAGVADWPAVEMLAPLRIINPYHLFGSITQTRIEPEVQIDSGNGWVAYPLWHKPGDVARAPDFVAPHQPRLDFQLWFHGLSPRGWPTYLEALVQSACHDPDAIQPFFRDRLPAKARAVRLAYWRYNFTNPTTRKDTGAYWLHTAAWARSPRLCGVVDE